MNPGEVKIGAAVRYHPIIGGKHDGHTYRVRAVGNMHGRPVAWLEGKAGCVDVRAISRLRGFIDDGYGRES